MVEEFLLDFSRPRLFSYKDMCHRRVKSKNIKYVFRLEVFTNMLEEVFYKKRYSTPLSFILSHNV